MTKTTLLAATLVTSLALPAFAGGMDEPVMEPEIVTAAVSDASSGSAYLPIILFAVIAAVASSN